MHFRKEKGRPLLIFLEDREVNDEACGSTASCISMDLPDTLLGMFQERKTKADITANLILAEDSASP
jgi:hypothetical protein